MPLDSVNTNASGLGTVTHNLGISGDYGLQITARNNVNFRDFTITDQSPNSFTVRVRDSNNNLVASASNQSFNWDIWA